MSCHSLKKLKFRQNLGTETMSVHVGVGDNRQVFTVHKNLLKKCTTYFEAKKMFDSTAGEAGLIFLNEEDPKVFKLFVDWVYTGTVEKPRTRFAVKAMPSQAEVARLEAELLMDFNSHLEKLVDLFALGERFEIPDLMNRATDAIQDGYQAYGTVFGPGLAARVFQVTKPNSKLRELCIASTVMHLDRGCTKLRKEVMMNCIILPGYLEQMLTWMTRNYALFGRRATEGWDNKKPNEGFSILNRSKLCSCHFHEHPAGHAHRGHENCVQPWLDCSHPEDKMDVPEIKIDLPEFGPPETMEGLEAFFTLRLAGLGGFQDANVH
ncbi:BTB POZ-like protein [Rutstroemia sp. NJR-2017a WRK4]|nr:BTB POZ-like protein [Rutstroemia sp. NJR-2017a WRK4]